MAVRFSVKDLKDLGRYKDIPEQEKSSDKPRKSSENKDNQILFIKQVEQHLGLEIVDQHRFHPKRLWRFDLAIPSRKLAIEVEGGIWVQGRHTRGSGFINDMEKYNEAAVLGWRLLRCPPDQLLGDKFFQVVKRALEWNG